MWATWWIWMAAGVVLAVLEVLLPSYVFLGFAIGAAVTGAVLLVGGPLAALLSASLPLLLVVFSVASLLAWIVLRLSLGVREGQVKTFDRDINDD